MSSRACLSPYLLIRCAEILAALIRNKENVIGVKEGIFEFFISQYADNTTFMLDGTDNSLSTSLEYLKLYAEVTGFCIYIEKTEVVWIGSKEIVQRSNY